LNCLECDAQINIPLDALEGEIVTCPECGMSFEVYKEEGKHAIRSAQVTGEDWGE
jgi:alpha-aminoadipate carrier protein LysW